MSPNLVFAAVATSATTWLDANSLVAVHVINNTTMVPAAAAASIAVLGTAANGTYAITTDVADGTSGDSPVLHWDNHLQRLYVGSQVETLAVLNDGARSLAVFSLDSLTAPTAFTLQPLKTNPNHGWGTGAAAATQNIVGVGGAADAVGYDAVLPDAAGLRLNFYGMKTMLTENGHSYLIIHASQAATTVEAKGNIYALPLVTKGYTNQGSLAKVDSIDFSIRADFPATDLYNAASTPAIVGTGALPIAATGTAIVSLQVVGHTVYATVSRAEAALNEPGLFYSQALFDHNGKIKEWTRWEKAAPSTLGATAIDADLFRSAVDPVSGRVWGVAGGGAGVGGTQVRTTTWTKSTTTNELAQAVNAQLTTGCYAILPIGRSTQNYGHVSLGTLT
jgi:hypothetical protein